MPNFLKNWRLMLVLGLILGLAALAIFAKAYREATMLRLVVKAAGDIQAGQEMTAKMLRAEEISGTLPQDVVTRPEEIVGLAAKGFIPGDTVLRRSMFGNFAGAGVEGELAQMPGHFGVAFAADIYTTVGGNVVKDSVVTVKVINKTEKKTDEVGQNIKVLAVSGGDGRDAKSVTLALTREQVDMVSEAHAKGCTFIFALQPRS